MPRRRLVNTYKNHTTKFRHGLDVEIPTIKILLYADDPDDVTESSAREEALSLGLMLERLRTHTPVSARLDPKYVCRYRLGDPKFIAKLNTVLGRESFDEIWLFGINQINLKDFSLGFFEGGPENELDGHGLRFLVGVWVNEIGTLAVLAYRMRMDAKREYQVIRAPHPKSVSRAAQCC